MALIYKFYISGDLNKHFGHSHLRNIRQEDIIECPACSVSLDYKQYLLAYAQIVYGIHLRY